MPFFDGFCFVLSMLNPCETNIFVLKLSEKWIKESEQFLKRMKEISSKEKKDRLEIINAILFTLNTLRRSVRGWRLWISNLAIMSQFTMDELKEIEKTLERQVQPIIEYDIEATKKWKDKLPQIRVPRRRRREEVGMYV